MSHAYIPQDALSRIVRHDGTLFSDDPGVAAEAAAFMGWTHLAQGAQSILPEIEALAEDARSEGVSDVVLLGMGGSSLAALVMGEVLASGYPRLHVLDTTSPTVVMRTLEATEPATTLYLVSSKSGGTVEPNALYSIFRATADEALGRDAAGRRFVAITDPGSSLQALAESEGMRACVLAPADVGGRYSALTAFGLLPAALIGIDVRRLVERAAIVERRFTEGDGDLVLARLLAGAHATGSDKLTIVAPPHLRVFGLWVEQLIAESLGKGGMGLVPVVELDESIVRAGSNVLITFSRGRHGLDRLLAGEESHDQLFRMPWPDPYDLGGWFVLWEYSTALAGAAMGINPFDQPDVARAKEATSAVLDGRTAPIPASPTSDGEAVAFAGALHAPPAPVGALSDALRHAFESLRDGDYLAILGYLSAGSAPQNVLSAAIPDISEQLGIPVCLEVGPRYLHSTGQLHKGGPDNGLFLLITTLNSTDIDVPGRPWTLRELYRAQAEGDFATLAALGRRVVHVVLHSASVSSLKELAEALLAASEKE